MPTETRLFGMLAAFSIQSSCNCVNIGRRSDVESFVSIAQAVVGKINLNANKDEKVRGDGKKLRASVEVPQYGQGWLFTPFACNT